MIGRHADDVRKKIGQSVEASGWRRKYRDKPNEMQSAAGQWDEDYSTPPKGHRSHIGLWEETHNKFVWK